MVKSFKKSILATATAGLLLAWNTLTDVVGNVVKELVAHDFVEANGAEIVETVSRLLTQLFSWPVAVAVIVTLFTVVVILINVLGANGRGDNQGR